MGNWFRREQGVMGNFFPSISFWHYGDSGLERKEE